MKTKKAFILLNCLEPKTLPNLSNYDIVCAIDGAYNHLEKNNIIHPYYMCINEKIITVELSETL